ASPPVRGNRVRILLWPSALLTSVMLLGACGLGSNGSEAAAPATSAASGDEHNSTAVDLPQSVKSFRSTRRYDVVARPERIRIPVIGVNSRLEELGQNANGTVEVPEDWDVAGWFEGGARPGQRGPAVILGHVDSRSGPAVFYRLRELTPGDKILIDQRDGRTAAFIVDRTERRPKTRFPTTDVYFPTLRPVLRLVTCGGSFDESSGHYRDNVIVFASLARR
ncbi:MAG: class F sortase, partial [Actinomycetota bacterium]|nr:class F sortase [Actinomycetota bacterium]